MPIVVIPGIRPRKYTRFPIPFSPALFGTTPEPPDIEIGVTTVLAGTDQNNAGLVLANLAVLSQPGTIQTISLYVRTAAGNLRLAIYDATGASGGAGTLKAETASAVALGPDTWNVLPVVTPVLLVAANYWLAFQVSSNTLSNAKDAAVGTYNFDSGFTYGAFPSTFVIDGSGTTSWSISAQLDFAPGVAGTGTLATQFYGK